MNEIKEMLTKYVIKETSKFFNTKKYKKEDIINKNKKGSEKS